MTRARSDSWTVEHVPVLGNPSVMAGDGRRERLCWLLCCLENPSFSGMNFETLPRFGTEGSEML